ncbi:DUF4238 domain-containing protein [Massilia sp. YMA4]|uniref:DUF4238 domain-containing protein n=1 Tax=Massilia sp. YMA4 TaxID=1593482 RepID=UPI000DD166CB|nr:DUF4238 domain-containing protein [Massilia sp. YMA4]AXA90821.1 hypothetical protein DPH57_06370 [Massilia sp. YMA4]
MATGEARNHHWVPQCYLKGFAKSRSKEAKLHVIDRKAGREFVTVPRNVASARDFNRVDLDGISPNFVESNLASFEGLVDKALERVTRDREIHDIEDRNLILNLMALLAVRNPAMRENVRRSMEQVMKRVLDLTIASEEHYAASFAAAVADGALKAEDVLPYETMREFLDRDECSISVSTTRHVKQELSLVDTILPLLDRRNWLLVRASADSGGFITSDHPVVLRWDREPPSGTFFSPGFGLRNTEVLLTLSHDVALIGSFNEAGGAVEVGASQAAHINSVVMQYADRQIYARDNRFWYLGPDLEMRRGGDALKHFYGR